MIMENMAAQPWSLSTLEGSLDVKFGEKGMERQGRINKRRDKTGYGRRRSGEVQGRDGRATGGEGGDRMKKPRRKWRREETRRVKENREQGEGCLGVLPHVPRAVTCLSEEPVASATFILHNFFFENHSTIFYFKMFSTEHFLFV